jgi:cytoskeletal protein CcmA (bactofilin family)
MATRDGVLEIALNSNWFFQDTKADDFIIRTQDAEQNIAIGTKPNQLSAIYITSNVINFNNSVNISGGFSITGQTNTDSNMIVGGNATICNMMFVMGNATYSNPLFLQSNITVKGTSTFSNNVLALNPVSLSNSLNIAGVIYTSNAAYITSNLWVNGSTSLSNNLNVSGISTFSNAVMINSNLWVNSNASFSNNVDVYGQVTVSNSAFLQNSLVVAGAATFSNDMLTHGNMSVSNAFNVGGRSHFSNTVTVTSNLWVNGRTSLSNNLNVYGTMTVSNQTFLQSNVVVAGVSTFSNNIYGFNPVSLSNVLNVAGKTDLSNALTVTSNVWVLGAMSLSNTLNVSGNATFSNIVTVDSNLTVIGLTSFSNNLNVYGQATISNNAYLQSNVVVAGDATFSNSIVSLGQVSVSNTLNVSGKTQLSNTLNVASNMWVEGRASFSNEFNVSGRVHMSNTLNVSSNVLVNGNTSLSNTLNVSGISTFSNVVYISSNLNVYGNTVASNNLIVKGSALLDSNLVVTGTSTFSNNVNIQGVLTTTNGLVTGGTQITSGTTTFCNVDVYMVNSNTTGLSNQNLFIASSQGIPGLYIHQKANINTVPFEIYQRPNGTAVIDNNADLVLNSYNNIILTNDCNVQPSVVVGSNRSFTVNGVAVFNSTITGNDNVVFNSNLAINGTTTLCNNLRVHNDATFESNVTVNSNINVFGRATVSNVITATSNTWFQGQASFSNTVNIRGKVDLSNALVVTSNAWIQGVASFSNTINVANNAFLQSNLIVKGTITLSNNLLALNPSTFSNTVAITSNLNMFGNAMFSNTVSTFSNLDVFGVTTFSNAVNVTGATKVTGTLAVMSNATFSNNVDVVGNSLFSGTMSVLGATTLSNTLNVLNNVVMESNVTVGSNLVIKGMTTFSNAVKLTSNLLVMGDITAMTLISSNVTVYDTQTVQSNLFVTNNATFCNTISVFGETTLRHHVYARSNLTVDGYLVVANNSTFSNPVSMLSNLVVNGPMTLSNTLFAVNQATMSNVVILNSNLTFSNYGVISLYSSNNRLGINTSNPSERLDVAGHSKFSSNVYVLSRLGVGFSNPQFGAIEAAGSNHMADTTAIYVRNIGSNNSNNTVSVVFGANLASTANGQAKIIAGNDGTSTTYGYVAVATTSNSGSTEKLRVTSAGYIGIGISNPSYIVHVYSSNQGGIMMESSDSNQGARVQFYNNDDGTTGVIGTSVFNYGLFGIGTSSASAVAIGTDNTERVRITSSGLVGIGNINPSYLLDVVSGTGASVTNCNAARFWTTGANNTTTDAIVLSEDSASATYRQALAWRCEVPGTTFTKARIWSMVGSGYNASMLGFDVADSSRVLQNRMAINNAGSIGIGTSNPSERLSIVGGNAKFDCNVYVMSNLSIGSSNLTRRLNVAGTMLISGTANNAANTNSAASYILLNTSDNTNGPGLAIQNIATNNQGIYFDSYYNNAETYTTTTPAYVISKTGGKFLIRYAAGGAANSTFTWSNALAVTSAGFIGIRTDSPTEHLEVVGNAKISSNIYAMNAIGIGKSNPSYALDVIGDINFTGTLNYNGSSFIGSRWASNTQGIFYDYSGCNVGIGTSSLKEKFTLSNGNAFMSSNLYVMNRIGVATSNPGYTLDVNGDINLNGIIRQNGSPAIFSQWSNTLANVFVLGSNVGIGTNAVAETFHVASGQAKFDCNVYVLSNLAVGKSNPSYNLDVAGTGYISGATIVDGRATFSNIVAMLSNVGMVGRVTCCNNLKVTSNITLSNFGTVNLFSSNSRLGLDIENPLFKLDVNGTINTTGFFKNGEPYVASQWSNTSNFVYIFNSNIGIGVSNPSSALVVNGDVQVHGETSTRGITILRSTGAESNFVPLPIQGFSNQQPDIIIYTPGSNVADSVIFKVGPSNDNVEKVRIAGNGYIGISTSNPTFPLHIENSNVISIYASGDVVTLSDISVKKNLQVIGDPLSKIQKIHGYTYERTDMDAPKKHAGVVAQEIYQVLPEVVTVTNTGTMSVAYGNMIALLIEGIKELNTKVDMLQSELDMLRAKL